MGRLFRSRGPSNSSSVSVILAFLALIGVLGAFNWLQKRNSSEPATVTLQVLAGEATVTRADAAPIPALKSGESATLQRSDHIQTSTDGKAKLTFSGGETTELGASTALSILELYQTPVSRALVVVLALDEGRTLTRIRHMLFQDMQFQVQTAVATAQASGTVFRVDALEKSYTRVEVYDGSVRVEMGEQSLNLAAGQGVDARFGQPLTPIAVAISTPLDDPVITPAQPVATSSAPATLTTQQQTLFPPVLTPTRPGDQFTTYTVKQGDTLSSIARQFGVSWKAIYEANRNVLNSPESIRPGQELRIPK